MAEQAATPIKVTRGDVWTWPFQWTKISDDSSAIPPGGKMAGLITYPGGRLELTIDNGRVVQTEATGEFVLEVADTDTPIIPKGTRGRLYIIAYDAGGDSVVQGIFKLDVSDPP